MIKKILEKIKQIRKNHERKKRFKKLRKIAGKIFNRKNLIKVVVIFSGLALIASYVLPYII